MRGRVVRGTRYAMRLSTASTQPSAYMGLVQAVLLPTMILQLVLSALDVASASVVAQATRIPQYRVFEGSTSNPQCAAANKFSGVALNTSFVSPSGDTFAFWGFYDGGTTWRWRFMPHEVGEWQYSWNFSDGSGSGAGSFHCIAAGGSPGVVGAYMRNPRWFAYNGVTPVHIKSFYNKAGGLIRQPISWAAKHYYDKFIAKGYNHHMSSGLLPILELGELGDGQPLADGPPALNSTVYTNKSDPAGSMQLDVWRSLEAHVSYLNDRDVIVDMFQGFDGGKHVSWRALSDEAKHWWVSYVVARLAPFANLGGFVFKWETPGDDPHGDVELADLLRELDPFAHLRTYEAENVTKSNQFARNAWSFASVEALGASCVPKHDQPGETCHPYLKESGASTQNHHDISLQGFAGKPVYMAEGHGKLQRDSILFGSTHWNGVALIIVGHRPLAELVDGRGTKRRACCVGGNDRRCELDLVRYWVRGRRQIFIYSGMDYGMLVSDWCSCFHTTINIGVVRGTGADNVSERGEVSGRVALHHDVSLFL